MCVDLEVQLYTGPTKEASENTDRKQNRQKKLDQKMKDEKQEALKIYDL